MEILTTLIDVALHLDVHLAALLAEYGTLLFLILFVIVFCETGLVVTPFLPGDSLLFMAGALTVTGAEVGFNLPTLMIVLFSAAVLGDNFNYWIGRWAGKRILVWGEGSRFFNRAAFDKTHEFYERYGGWTMLVARFMPFVRTFAPFVAGVARMDYRRYLTYDTAGAVLWVVSMTGAGYLFGNIPWVRNNLMLIVLALIFIPALPAVIAWTRLRLSQRSAGA
ncbi:MAG: DedA family protein [Rhodocyclaceae bacterium]|jgi:membrane-associated protein|nr:DedA family protein [Rhodocyclaceae bacterium]MBK6907443.1 DedA family protein [Rhodocyclaceae bacterium]